MPDMQSARSPPRDLDRANPCGSADFVGKGEVLAEATSTRQQGVQGETLEKQPKMRHMTLIPPGGVIGAVREVGK